MDTAKALVLTDARPFAHLLGKTTPNTADHELINIPTTCGTGAEISSGGIYFMKSTGLKTAIVGQGVDHAVLIPELVEKLPFKIFFLSSMDALSHAVEGYLYSDSCVNEFGLAIARAAITTIVGCHAELCVNGVGYRTKLCRKFLIASTMGNMSLTAAGANLVHALAYPVAEKFHMAHGESVYQYLIPVLKLYERECPDGERLAELREMLAPALARAGFPAHGSDTFDQLQAMLNSLFPLRTMTEAGMTEADIEPFSRNIIETKQRLLTKAYLPFREEWAAELYRERL
jgi:4-hydroxybutyrate dehydrogenase